METQGLVPKVSSENLPGVLVPSSLSVLVHSFVFSQIAFIGQVVVLQPAEVSST